MNQLDHTPATPAGRPRKWYSRPLGVRARLTLLSVAIVSLLYMALGLSSFQIIKGTITGSIDKGLLQAARGIGRESRRRPPPPGHDGPPFGMAGPPPGPGFPDGRDPFHSRRISPVDLHDDRPHLLWASQTAHFPFPRTGAIDTAAVADARNGKTTLRTVVYEDEPVRVITFPAYDPDSHELQAVIELHYWLGDVRKVFATLGETLLLMLPVGMLLMGWASLYVVGKTLRPIRQIVTAAGRIEAEDLSGRLPVSGKDEFTELAVTMNGMLDRLGIAFDNQRQTLDQLKEVIQQQRRFTADASHELKTPLAVVKVNASLLKSTSAATPDALESIDAIDAAVNRMSKLVQDLLLLARTDSGQIGEQFEPVDLVSIARSAGNLAPCTQKLTIDHPAEPLVVYGSHFALERLVANLLENACRHTEPQGRVKLSVRREEQFAMIQVQDDGEGIPADHLDKIFTRFHRVDESRHSGTGGTGLGLAIVKGIVEAHNGTLAVTSTLNQGSTFTITLPRPPEQ